MSPRVGGSLIWITVVAFSFNAVLAMIRGHHEESLLWLVVVYLSLILRRLEA